MIHRNISLSNPFSEIIRTEIHYNEGAKEEPCIVICHGFKGFKNWAFFPLLAESLAYAGYIAITFNFSRNGIGALTGAGNLSCTLTGARTQIDGLNLHTFVQGAGKRSGKRK